MTKRAYLSAAMSAMLAAMLIGCNGDGLNGDADAIAMSRHPGFYPLADAEETGITTGADFYGYQEAPRPERRTRDTTTDTRRRLDANSVINDWPDASQSVARDMIDRYGQPDGATSDMLIWNNNGPWKRTIVHRQPVMHNFPTQHPDVLEQTINYRVPPEMYDELAQFDGSIFAKRTAGELTAMCHLEAMNILALNLANEIVENNMPVDVARQRLTEMANAYMNGERPSMTQEFQFDTQDRGTNDPDVPASSMRRGFGQPMQNY